MRIYDENAARALLSSRQEVRCASRLDPDAMAALAEQDRMEVYECELANGSDEWRSTYWTKDDEGYYRRRFAVNKLSISTGSIFANTTTPAGVPVFFNHFSWGSALGRILSAECERWKAARRAEREQPGAARLHGQRDQRH